MESIDQRLIERLFHLVQLERSYSWDSLDSAVTRLHMDNYIKAPLYQSLEKAIHRLEKLHIDFPLSQYELFKGLRSYSY